MADAGLIVIVSLVSPFRGDRRAAKGLFAEGDFLEVWVDTPSDVVVERDPKGLYAKAKAGALPNMTGVGQGYEPPENPDVASRATARSTTRSTPAAGRARGRALTGVRPAPRRPCAGG